jgi:hypothetical protein
MSIYIRRCGDPFHRYHSICIRSLGISPLFLDPLMIVVVDLDSVDRDDSPLPDDIVASIEQILVYLILGHLLQLEYETSRPIGNRPFHVAHVGLSRNLNLLYNSDDRIRLILTSFVSQ